MDVLVRNGTVVTANEVYKADVGIEGGRIKQIGIGLGAAAREIDASGKYVFPGAVDAHPHCECELVGAKTVDDWTCSTEQAACGGVTTVIDYALAGENQPLTECLERWHATARPKAIIDYGLHPALYKPSDRIIDEMADVVSEGHTSFKVLMTGLAAFDECSTQYMKAIAGAGSLGALVEIHCEDQTCISFVTQRLEAEGRSDIRHYAGSRLPIAEGIAAQRALNMAKVADAAVYLVHLSCRESMDAINEARARGQSVYAETRPIYLHLSRDRFEEKIDPERFVGWPLLTLSRGEVVVESGKVLGKPGRGRLLKCKKFADIRNIENVR